MNDAAGEQENGSAPALAVRRACRDAHERLSQRIEVVDDVVVRRPSRLPGWTIGHVLTHLSRNADSFVRILEAAGEGIEVVQYPGGPAQREGEIETGAARSAAAIVNDCRTSGRRLDEAFASAPEVAWAAFDRCRQLPYRRLREVELHHVDLGLGYEPGDWSEEVVALLLEDAARRLPDVIAKPAERAAFVAWITGRAASPGIIDLEPF
jgi:maleylpyruvate isomerase